VEERRLAQEFAFVVFSFIYLGCENGGECVWYCVLVLAIQVVLVVYASDCFTLAASTVGISLVLSTAKKVVLGLSEAREYQLMVCNSVSVYSWMSIGTKDLQLNIYNCKHLSGAMDNSGAKHYGTCYFSVRLYNICAITGKNSCFNRWYKYCSIICSEEHYAIISDRFCAT